MIEGCEAGQILTGGVLAPYFEEAYQPIYFVADGNLTETDTVKVRVGLIEGIIGSSNPIVSGGEQTESKAVGNKRNVTMEKLIKKTKEPEPHPMNPGTFCFPEFLWSLLDLQGEGSGVIKDKSTEIMLGETKYFAVKKKDTEYKIEEIQTNFGEEPMFPADLGGWVWQKTDVWGSDPIEKLGTKSGVYWEKKWYKSTDYSNQDLDNGMIRLVGHFWEEGKEDSFKVNLIAPGLGSIEISVVKPDTLLSDGQTDNYIKAKDVFDNEYNIDSLCLYYGGKFGIPPQMLKGQMFTESAKKNFGGNVGNGFAPSYRYEAYTVQFWDVVKDIIKANTNPFIVDSMVMGKTGAANVPTTTEHKHVLFYHYFEYPPKTVWEIIEENSSLVDVNNTITIYGFQYKGTGADTLKKGQVKSGVYSAVDNNYLNFLRGPKDKKGNRSGGYEDYIRTKYKLKPDEKLSLAQQTEANDSARIALIDFLKNDFNGKLDSIPAQTRIASSYGLLQILYTTALKEHNYPTSDSSRPENLNEVKISMDYAIQHLKKLFNRWNGFSTDSSSNWASNYQGNDENDDGYDFPKPSPGFEETLAVMHHFWNPGEHVGTNATYHEKVLNNSKKFLPRSK